MKLLLLIPWLLFLLFGLGEAQEQTPIVTSEVEDCEASEVNLLEVGLVLGIKLLLLLFPQKTSECPGFPLIYTFLILFSCPSIILF